VSVGVLDMALWDALAKAKRQPLWKLLADRYNGGNYDDKAWVYAAGGYYYPGKDLEGLQDEMKHYLDLGYTCVKMKVGGVPLAEDLKRIEAVLRTVGSGERLAVDVNGRFDLPTAMAFGKAIEAYGLRWYEEPLDPLDYLAHGRLRLSMPRPSRRAKTCSRCRTPATSFATAGCDLIATSCSSIRRCPMAWSSTCAPACATPRRPSVRRRRHRSTNRERRSVFRRAPARRRSCHRRMNRCRCR
jgi:hypothetical protein